MVTKDVADFALVIGNPARQVGWVDEKGKKMKKMDSNIWTTVENINYQEKEGVLIKIDSE